MTTALLLILPAIGTVLFGAIANALIGSKIPEVEAISAVWPTVIEALPPVELEDRDGIPVGKAA
jgi:hypothetical protein